MTTDLHRIRVLADADCEVPVDSGDEFAMDGSHGVVRLAP